MKIGIVSPLYKTGITSYALLLGYALAYTQSDSVFLTYSGDKTDIKDYVGYTDDADITRSIEQAVKLLQADAISAKDINQFTCKLGKNLNLLDTADGSISVNETTELLTYVMTHVTDDVVLCDISSAFSDRGIPALVESCDIILAVSDPSVSSLKMVREMMETEKCLKEKTCGLVINKYDPNVAPMTKLAKIAGFSMRNTLKLHYNPFIIEGCNKHNLDSVIPYILKKDPRVIELNNDLQEAAQFCYSFFNKKVKWEK